MNTEFHFQPVKVKIYGYNPSAEEKLINWYMRRQIAKATKNMIEKLDEQIEEMMNKNKSK